jgi:hypothetical protein
VVCLRYRHHDDRRSKHFILAALASPSSCVANGWTCTNRTGDIGRRQEGGALAFNRRETDNTQAVIRGELYDIVGNIILTNNGTLREAIVALQDGDPGYLVAHIILSQHHNMSSRKAFLHHLLSQPSPDSSLY